MLQRLIIFHWDYTNNKQVTATAPGRIYYYQMTLTDLGALGLIIIMLFCYINQRIKLKSIASFKV